MDGRVSYWVVMTMGWLARVWFGKQRPDDIVPRHRSSAVESAERIKWEGALRRTIYKPQNTRNTLKGENGTDRAYGSYGASEGMVHANH